MRDVAGQPQLQGRFALLLSLAMRSVVCQSDGLLDPVVGAHDGTQTL